MGTMKIIPLPRFFLKDKGWSILNFKKIITRQFLVTCWMIDSSTRTVDENWDQGLQGDEAGPWDWIGGVRVCSEAGRILGLPLAFCAFSIIIFLFAEFRIYCDARECGCSRLRWASVPMLMLWCWSRVPALKVGDSDSGELDYLSSLSACCKRFCRLFVGFIVYLSFNWVPS